MKLRRVNVRKQQLKQKLHAARRAKVVAVPPKKK